MSDALHPLQPASDAETSRQPVSVRVAYNRNELIYGAGAPLDSWYEVVSGSVRACRILETGGRQVVEFYLPGDIFGFDDVDTMHGLTTEAAADRQTVLIRHWRNRLNSRMALDPMLALRLRSLALCRLAATRNRIATLGLLTAVERVWDFLMEMKDRLVLDADLDGHPVVTIPIESKDIVDYLGIKPEILRRSIQSLRQQGAIELVAPGRIKLLGETPFVLSATSRPTGLNMRQNFFKAARPSFRRDLPAQVARGGAQRPSTSDWGA